MNQCCTLHRQTTFLLLLCFTCYGQHMDMIVYLAASIAAVIVIGIAVSRVYKTKFTRSELNIQFDHHKAREISSR